MILAEWSDDDSTRAKRIWVEYQQRHDLSGRIGQTAGIDPRTGRIWFGESIRDVVSQRDAEGLDSPLLFERVGSDAYFRQGNHH